MTSLAPIAQSSWQGCRIPRWQLDLRSRVGAAIDHALDRIERTPSLLIAEPVPEAEILQLAASHRPTR
jgi:hypothetical protein